MSEVTSDPQKTLDRGRKSEKRKIIEENQREVAEMADNGGSKARRETPMPKARVDPTTKTGAMSDGAKSFGKCFICDQRGQRAEEHTSGGGNDSEASAAGAETSVAEPSQAHIPSARATGTRQPRPVNDGKVAVAQRTKGQQSAWNEGVRKGKAFLIEENQEDQVFVVPMNKRQLVEVRAALKARRR